MSVTVESHFFCDQCATESHPGDQMLPAGWFWIGSHDSPRLVFCSLACGVTAIVSLYQSHQSHSHLPQEVH